MFYSFTTFALRIRVFFYANIEYPSYINTFVLTIECRSIYVVEVTVPALHSSESANDKCIQVHSIRSGMDQ